jgi:hypothetical protein
LVEVALDGIPYHFSELFEGFALSKDVVAKSLGLVAAFPRLLNREDDFGFRHTLRRLYLVYTLAVLRLGSEPNHEISYRDQS